MSAYLLDTRAWIRLVARDPRAAEIAALPGNVRLSISGISLWEAAMLHSRGRVNLLPDCATWMDDATNGLGIRVIPISIAVALRSVNLPDDFPKDPSDRIIAASALHGNAELITSNRRMSDCAPRIGLRVRALSGQGKN